MLSKTVSITIFWVFVISQPGIEHRSTEPLVNTLLIKPMTWFNSIWLSMYNLIIKNLLYNCLPRIIYCYLKTYNWCKLFVLDRNTWNHITVYILFMLDRNARKYTKPSWLGVYNTSIASLHNGQNPTHNDCPGYYSKQSNGEASEMLKLWGMPSNPFIVIAPRSLLSRCGSTWSGFKYGSNRWLVGCLGFMAYQPL